MKILLAAKGSAHSKAMVKEFAALNLPGMQNVSI